MRVSAKSSPVQNIAQKKEGIVLDILSPHGKKGADFETAIEATGYGKFHYLLLITVIPVLWCPSFDTGNMSMILPTAECELKLTLFHKGILNSIIYAGMICSAFLWGYVADVQGRRKLLIYGFLADAICNILCGIAQDFWTLVFLKFSSGFIQSGPYAVTMSYCAEFHVTRNRSKVMMLLGLYGSMGIIMNAVLAWMIIPRDWSLVLFDQSFVLSSWRIYLMMCGVPTLVGVACLYFFPESPKFLMSRGHNDKALRILRKIYVMNTGNTPESYPITSLENELARGISADDESTTDIPKINFREGLSQMKPLFQFPLLVPLLLVVSLQFCVMLAGATFRLWMPQIFALLDKFSGENYNYSNGAPGFCEILDFSTAVTANNTVAAAESIVETECKNIVVDDRVYLNSIIMSCTVAVGFVFVGALLKFIGNKKLLLICLIISLVSILTMIWASERFIILFLSCLYVGILTTLINVVIGVAVEVFPTTLRTMAVSLTMMLGRVGSLLGNLLFPVLLTYGCIYPIIELSGFIAFAMLLTLVLPKPPGNLK
ncbi:synaptic vesicle glycoprotein 2B [Cephus cinctus]|uniref:Synaptic vesicle glycoprotein 2B n=1 Tax=Cephus cinctus TaxID=211228 RepID=A0AAJ7CGU3_CEPCN|nr:synaptic vesicle glycoprotein 2B [Cephus cinctus]